jgi:hypothetical protein
MRTYNSCRFSKSLADGDASTCAFAEFSSKWRTGFSHLRGGSYNQTVVLISTQNSAGALTQGRSPDTSLISWS